MLKAFQITRSLIPGLSLGAADTALRTTLDFALTRRLYGTSVFEIPQAQRQLVEAFVDVLICECVATAAVRALHVMPEEMSIGSAVVKYFVPTMVEKIFRMLSIVLGARHYLREGHWHGTFQKFSRDNSILVLFDGNTVVNLNAIALQLQQLAATRAKGGSRDVEMLRVKLAGCFSLQEPLPDFDPAKLTLHNRGRDTIVQGLQLSFERLMELKPAPDLAADVLQTITSLTRQMLEAADAHTQLLQETLARDDHMHGKSPALFDLAEDYCALFAGAACVHMWLHNRARLGAYFARGEWLALALQRVQQRLRGARARGCTRICGACGARVGAAVPRAHALFHPPHRTCCLAPAAINSKLGASQKAQRSGHYGQRESQRQFRHRMEPERGRRGHGERPAR